MAETFRECFCRHFRVPLERYAEEALQRALTPRARVLHRLLQLSDRDYFAADREFIACVGQLTRQGDFFAEVQDFHYHPGNRRLLRRTLRLRVSANRMRRIIREVWPEFASRTPFG